MLYSCIRDENSRSSDLTWKKRQPRISPEGSTPCRIPVCRTAETSQPCKGFASPGKPIHSPWGVNSSLDKRIFLVGLIESEKLA